MPTDPSQIDLSDPVVTALQYVKPEVVMAAYKLYDSSVSDEDKIKVKLQDLGPVPRLRMGIERFLITDINNPAASAKHQVKSLLCGMKLLFKE